MKEILRSAQRTHLAINILTFAILYNTVRELSVPLDVDAIESELDVLHERVEIAVGLNSILPVLSPTWVDSAGASIEDFIGSSMPDTVFVRAVRHAPPYDVDVARDSIAVLLAGDQLFDDVYVQYLSAPDSRPSEFVRIFASIEQAELSGEMTAWRVAPEIEALRSRLQAWAQLDSTGRSVLAHAQSLRAVSDSLGLQVSDDMLSAQVSVEMSHWRVERLDPLRWADDSQHVVVQVRFEPASEAAAEPRALISPLVLDLPVRSVYEPIPIPPLREQYPALSTSWQDVRSKTISGARAWIEEERERQLGGGVEIPGMKPLSIRPTHLNWILPSVQMALLTHLIALVLELRRRAPVLGECPLDSETSWIAAFPGRLSRWKTRFELCALPVGANLLGALKWQGSKTTAGLLVAFLVLSLTLGLITCHLLRIVRQRHDV
ncbi:MAG: hypothetical protein ACT4PE_04405 [Candidatus Eiseniibacteriota bacterium]